MQAAAHIWLTDKAIWYWITVFLRKRGDVKPGCRVQVPLRNRTATGTVLTLSEPAPAWKDRLKPILKTDRSGAPDFPR